MTPVSLEAFIHEYRLTFPIGVDQPGDGEGVSLTMRRFGMCGTPTTIVIDREGRILVHAFGSVEDLTLGVLIGSLTAQATISGLMPISDAECVDEVYMAPPADGRREGVALNAGRQSSR